MFDFPNNPSDGDQVSHPNGDVYEYQGDTWYVVEHHEDLLARITALATQSLFLLE